MSKGIVARGGARSIGRSLFFLTFGLVLLLSGCGNGDRGSESSVHATTGPGMVDESGAVFLSQNAVGMELSLESSQTFFHRGSTIKMSWTSEGDVPDGFQVLLSTDSGRTFSKVVADDITADAKSFEYPVEDEKCSFCQFKVQGKGASSSSMAVSQVIALNTYFAIADNPKGKTFAPDDFFDLIWETDLESIPDGIVIEMSLDSMQSWEIQILEEALDIAETSFVILFPDSWLGEPLNSAPNSFIRIRSYNENDLAEILGPFTVRVGASSLRAF